MTETCELCGRGMARKMITPTWWPYTYVCERKACKEATRDALEAVETSRETFDDLVKGVSARYEVHSYPWGYRTDTMARIQFEETWWATEVAKSV